MTTMFRAAATNLDVETQQALVVEEARTTLCKHAGREYGKQADEVATLLAVMLPSLNDLIRGDASFERYVRCSWDISFAVGPGGTSLHPEKYRAQFKRINNERAAGFRYLIQVDVRVARLPRREPTFKDHFWLCRNRPDEHFALRAARRFEANTIIGFLTGDFIENKGMLAGQGANKASCRIVNLVTKDGRMKRLRLTTEMTDPNYRAGFGLQFMKKVVAGSNVVLLSNGCVLANRRIETGAAILCTWKVHPVN